MSDIKLIPIFVSNSAVNPFTYAFFKRDIKKEIKKLVYRTTFKKDNRVEPINRSNSCSNIRNVLRWTFFDPMCMINSVMELRNSIQGILPLLSL